MSEFDPFDGGDDIDPHAGPGAPEAPSLPDLAGVPGLMRASDLLPDEEHDQGDFEPSPEGTRYKGFLLVPKHLWPNEPQHAHLAQRFYVETLIGTIGLVPWEGSQIVWPWHAAWSQDLHRTEVTPLLKDEKEAKKKR